MKFKSPIFAQASGSLGGTTFAHNKGGQYVRNRSTPINPASSFQQAVRNSLTSLTSRWSNTLTPAQREAWKTYAVNVPIINKLGEARIIPELSMYLRCNSPRLTNVGPTAIVDDAPTIYSLATFTLPVASEDTTNFKVEFTNTDDWAIDPGGFLFVYMSRGQNPSINFWKGPYRFALHVDGDHVLPPTSPVTAPPIFAFASGSKYFVRFQASNPDGRLSSSLTGSFLVA